LQFIGILLVFGGYTLVYSAVAGGGRFATEPWAALYGDAYTLDNQDWANLANMAAAAGTGLKPNVPGGFSPLSPTPPVPLP